MELEKALKLVRKNCKKREYHCDGCPLYTGYEDDEDHFAGCLMAMGTCWDDTNIMKRVLKGVEKLA